MCRPMLTLLAVAAFEIVLIFLGVANVRLLFDRTVLLGVFLALANMLLRHIFLI